MMMVDQLLLFVRPVFSKSIVQLYSIEHFVVYMHREIPDVRKDMFVQNRLLVQMLLYRN